MFPEVCQLFDTPFEQLLAGIEEDTTDGHRELAREIVELFEDLLEAHGIIIPDADRPEDNDTPLYGCTYGDLVDKIEEVLRNAEL